MNTLGPKFWNILKGVLLALILAALVATALCVALLEGWRQIFFTGCSLLVALNFGLMYFFARVNDRRRPRPRR